PHLCEGALALVPEPRLPGAAGEEPPAALVQAAGLYTAVGATLQRHDLPASLLLNNAMSRCPRVALDLPWPGPGVGARFRHDGGALPFLIAVQRSREQARGSARPGPRLCPAFAPDMRVRMGTIRAGKLLFAKFGLVLLVGACGPEKEPLATASGMSGTPTS